jgi:hypothetical protein
MSGETEKSQSAWTTDTVLAHMISLLQETEKRLAAADTAAEKANQQRFDAQQQGVKDALTAQKEAVAAALVAAEKAVLVAETNAEKWRLAANEWRGAMNDRERTLMPRSEAEASAKSDRARVEEGLRSINDKVDALQARLDRNEGRAAILQPAFEQLAKDSHSMQNSRSVDVGERGGKNAQQQLYLILIPAFIISVISIIGTVVAVAFAIRK